MNAPPTIIVVEDDEGLNRLIQRTLQREGFRTEGVLNGADALAKVADNRHSILLLDYDISDMNGKQLVETLIEKKYDVPFIIVTGQGNEQIAVEMMKLGAMDYIVKGNDFIDIFPHLIKRVVKELDYKNLLKKSEEDLRKSEERYRRLTEAI
ncbi:MAG: response regulator, partial [Deferribacteres bacterium]|nr:response regulator [Deferribacteres bacterium]